MAELSFAGTLAMVALTIQNAALAITLKLSHRPGARPYSGAVAVLCVECLKFVLCSTLVHFKGKSAALKQGILNALRTPEMSVPSLLYVVQNNVLIGAARYLSQTAFIVGSQGKVISSAIFSYIILKKQFRREQLVALGMLACGISIIQLENADGSNSTKQTELLGVLMMLIANLTSGYAGVFLERLFKTQDGSIWLKNLQLSLFSIPIAICSIFFERNCCQDTTSARPTLLQGFDSVVIAVIGLNSIGGLITALVMRFASAVLKCFAVSFSICLCTFSELLHGHVPGVQVITGILLVSSSMYIYTRG